MKEMYREEVMNKLASDDVDALDVEDLIESLQDIYINGVDPDWPPYINWTDEELEDEWLERYDEQVCVVDVKSEDNCLQENLDTPEDE